MAGFLTDAEWESSDKFDGTSPIPKWKEIPEKILFCLNVIEQKQVPGLKFETFILNFTDKQGEEYRVYAPSHFIKQIRKNRQRNMRPYFISHGTVEKAASTIASFELTYKVERKTWDIFEIVEYKD